MTSSSTIIGITRQSPVDADFLASDENKTLAFGTADSDLVLNPAMGEPEIAYEDSYEETLTPRAAWRAYIVPSLLIASLLAWSGYFIWVNRGESFSAFAGQRGITLIGSWAVPALLIAVAWLIMLRSSRTEAGRFSDVALALRTESDALQIRMRTVNEEIAMAREFLAQNALELESVGRHSASRLMEAAEHLGAALADSDAKAKTLESVSNAAATNLEQLRKHLPVVTSAAKDVTNQIGSAGNSAQLQVKTLIAALQRVADAGTNARENIEGLEVRAGEAAMQLSHIIAQSSQALETSVSDASSRTDKIVNTLDEAQTRIMTDLGNANEDIASLVDNNVAKLTQQVEMLRESILELSIQSTSEDTKVSAMIERISSHIDDRASVLAELDTASTERTVKLAFAVEALVSSTNALNQGLAQSGESTNALSEHSQKLISALNAAKHELEIEMPEALTRAEIALSGSLSQFGTATTSAMSLDGVTDELLVKLATIQRFIATQADAMQNVIHTSDTQFSSHQEQTDALAASLIQTRAMMEELAETANESLITALHQVRDSTQEAAQASRLILDDEMSHVAERLTNQSRDALTSAIDRQVAALNEMIQKSFDDNITLSQQSTQLITAQLAEINSMTTSLEARIESARDGFSGLDDDSFARQMVTLTESLNSTAIDVAKILSNEVTDTSWAAYLKGDRGVFTRRAVRLLDAGEAKAIAVHYGDDAEFRDHVNRYIHDFESMMRVLLSTRDGNAIGVTLLSSDVGKLYVALAQAIERLRN